MFSFFMSIYIFRICKYFEAVSLASSMRVLILINYHSIYKVKNTKCKLQVSRGYKNISSQRLVFVMLRYRYAGP